MAADTHLLVLLAFFAALAQGTFYELAFVESPQYSVALPGDSVYFNCRTNLPSALENITWLHNGQPLPWKPTRGLLTFKVSTDPQVFSQQEGTYQCVGGAQGSQFQLASPEARLSIAKLDNFRYQKDELIEVFEGNDIIIPCDVPKSIPPAFVQFAKNGQLLTDDNANILNGDTLVLRNVSTESSGGNYTCIASNHITSERKTSPNTIVLSVLPVTKNEKSRLIHRPRDNYEVNVDEDVYVPCTASGVPKPDIVWTKLNDNQTLTVVDGILSIKNAKPSQGGHYMCAVFNGARRFVRRTSVTVIVPPKFLQESMAKVVAQEGDTLTLPCPTSGSPPPSIQWRINGYPIQEPMAVNQLTGELVIPNPSAEDHTGFYQCFAYNKGGQIVSKTFVQVGEDILSPDDYEPLDEVETIRDFHGHVSTSPTAPNVTQVSAESVVLQWDLEDPEEEGSKPIVPVKFFKIQFREFFRGKVRSSWHTLDEVIGPEVRAFEILGLHNDRRYRFRVVVVFENNDSRSGPLSKKFRMNADTVELAPRPKPPADSPSINSVLPLGPTSLRIGWVLNEGDDVEGYFIHYKPLVSDEKFKKITILGATSHSFIIDALIPGTEYEIKIQAFNLAGASPSSNVTRQTTSALPPVTSAEVSEEDAAAAEEVETKEDGIKDDEAIKYLTLGGALAGCLVVFMALCTVFNLCQRRRTEALQKSCGANGHTMTEIQDKYNDTAVQISNHQSYADLDAARCIVGARSNQSFLSTKEISNFEMTLLADPRGGVHHANDKQGNNHSISDSMFSSGHNSADLNSLGNEEYNDEPSKSWRRSRRSEESFI